MPHDYHVKVLNKDPLVFLFENFLLPGEAEHFMRISKPRLIRSYVGILQDDGTHPISEGRTSYSAYLLKFEDKVVACVEARAAMVTGIPLPDGEALQVVHYDPGQKYEPHYDYFPREDLLKDGTGNCLGQRVTTFLVYLNDDNLEGGETRFPQLNLVVQPKKNSALFWYNVNSTNVEDTRTLHGGMPVLRGEKYAINIWHRQRIPS